ncbi:peptidoglycan editing factor PgeF [Shewanella gelidimarina]|uniref:peptidoglycan editing factor PgeF n=1 Tax=Shewanella gelidimarina TaxID=56813 RepID=UPI00200C2923|nr:peptidoglycan editing factor PgeF [Shewanella gelidimarina]MCL1059548.1 peptidoglycan editing factor PgeF [Shewanella gelidimarina]
MTDVFDEKQAWFIPPGVNLAFSTRQGGISLPPFDSLNLGAHVGDNITRVNGNRQIILQRLNLPVTPAWLEQTHSIKLVNADNSEVHHADGSYCNNSNQVCVVMTADCLPILLCDKNGTEVAAVHAGWRGLCDGIIEAAINKFSHSPQELVAYLGPAIGPKAFEVGSEVKQQFEAKHPEAQHFFVPVREHLSHKYLADLQGLAKLRLAKAGVKTLFADTRCTVTDNESFFSYRRDGVTGRMASFIWLDA